MSRRKFNFTKEQLEDMLINQGLSIGKAAKLIGCSNQTVYEREKEFGIDLSFRQPGTVFLSSHPNQISLRYIRHRQAQRKRPEGVSECYLKEARAMLQGKHWQGKNKCTKLVGDEP